MKKILFSLAVILVVGGVVWGATQSFFNDVETSSDNIFTAGSIDLKVDHTKQTYNGADCVGDCTESGANLVVNGGFETPNVPTGGWAIYPDAGQTSWTVESGAGLEIQDHAAGDPHGGNQLAELDSENPSVISQNLVTIPGQKYRLTFWFSPRPNIPAGDNTIGARVEVVSDSTVLVNDVIGTTSAGGSNTSWTQETYNFIATDDLTKIKFSDLGIPNSFGGYLDDISVRELECTSSFSSGGICTLWGEKDLGSGDVFFNFDDVKPADWGTNVISLHVTSNDAYACLLVNNKDDQENSLLIPETIAGDVTGVEGELSEYINVFTWEDLNGDGVYNTGEKTLGSGSLSDLSSIMSMDSSNSEYLVAGDVVNIGLAWCAGDLTPNPDGAFSCDGNGMGNIAQSDSFTADLTAFAEQIRNNESFSCAGVQLP